MTTAPEDVEPDVEDETSPSALDQDEDPETHEAFDLPIASQMEGDLDDSAAADLDPGVELPMDDEGGDDTESGITDPFAFLSATPEDADEHPDESGPVGDDPASALEEAPALDEDDGEESAERLEDLLTSDLPSLDAEADDADSLLPETPDGLVELGEDETLRHAEISWSDIPTEGLPRGVELATSRAPPGALLGGREILFVDDAGVPRKLGTAFGGYVASLLQTSDGTVIFTTRGGELGRLSQGRDAAERLVAFREAAGGVLGEPELVLGGPTPSQRPAVLLHVRDEGRTLLESTDQGTTFRRVDLGGRVLVLSRGTPPACLVETERGLRLFVSEPTGGFSAVGSAWTQEGDDLVIATHGDVVAILEPGVAVSVSSTRGAEFKVVTGTSRVTALTAGRLGSRASAFAAVFEPASGRALLVWIDAASGEGFVVATLEPDGAEDTDDLFRVTSLAWEPNDETLWAAGAFGVRRFRRPPSA